MTTQKSSRPVRIPIKAVVVTAVLTLMIAGGTAHRLGYLHRPPTGGSSPAADTAGQTDERKIAYWRAPMNPTEIYDQPGKSAMGMDLVPVYADEVGAQAGGAAGERKIAYWRAPMNPAEIYDQPGKSAMGMDLVPVYEDELVGGVAVTVDPVIQQNMGLRTAVARRQDLAYTIRTYGHVTADETRTAQVSPKSGGWIERLHVDFTGKFVRRGEPLFELYAPELLAAQEEYLVAWNSLKSLGGQANRNMLASSRRRLRYFDVADTEIDRIETDGKVQKTLVIRSPFSGYVIERNVEAGEYIKQGTTVLRIADLSRVWVEAHIYEHELPWVKTGQEAVMQLSYHPGRKFAGRVAYVYPYLQPKTRDVVIRIEFENPDLLLKPQMYADVYIKTGAGTQGLVIPSEAVLRSGERNVAFVERDGNKFTPRDVTLGRAVDGGMVQVLTGLASGEVVVTSGQFLLDSESKLKEAVQKMLAVKRADSADAGGPEAGTDDFFDDMDDEDDFFDDLEAPEDDFFDDLEAAP